ncbi:M56 family metallopeptidase [Desulfuromonas acetexigens]|uniref:M56 family metallopeptidase n=1 Tax=Trichloromonas acetexigens TaxID=38815 RepID=A0A550JBD8_9BACT|nr:M56 family metallopeptidase [Desulfuromonas acetexigens]TRO80568.1 M56 family metallopeptidase [Desulfuromonas acetexigens]
MESLLWAFGATVVVGLGAGVVLGVVYPLLRKGLLKRQPRRRATILLLLATAPGSLGLFFAGLLFISSLMEFLGISAGHCHNHAERFPHICLSEPAIFGSGILPGYLYVPAALLLAMFLARQAIHLRENFRLKTALRQAEVEGGLDCSLVQWRKPAAVTVGFWSPKVFLSTTLARTLTPEQLQVVLAHEQAHVRHRDPLRQYLARTASVFYPGRVRGLIREDLALATEQACDEQAAEKTGDRLLVAETIIAVERLLGLSLKESQPFSVGFSGSQSILRIEALLAGGDYSDPVFPDWLLFSPPLFLTHLVLPGPVHYLTELVIRH